MIRDAIGAAPAFKEFGLGFITRVEWDPVNDQYGAMIAIYGTLATSIIALAVAFVASPQAGYITGQELHVNGGMYM
mgnify:CR=1 FL=1